MEAALYSNLGASIKILITSHKPTPVQVTWQLRGCGEFDLKHSYDFPNVIFQFCEPHTPVSIVSG